jgi:hypothetical protein
MQRARMSRRCRHCRLLTRRCSRRSLSCMLHRLPIQVLGDIPRHGLVLRVHCSRCGRTRPVEIGEELQSRRFGRQRFRCTTVLPEGTICPGDGAPIVSELEQRRIDGFLDVPLYFLFCQRCVPDWQISAINVRRAPWNVIDSWSPGDRFRCPACHGRVDWHVHDRPWRPSAS